MRALPQIQMLLALPCPTSVIDLINLIVVSGGTRVTCFAALRWAIACRPTFVSETVPFLHATALRTPELLGAGIPALDDDGEVVLSQEQCLCILANAFFCTFVDRISDNCCCADGLPSINLDELYEGPGEGSPESAKLAMLFDYFEECRRRAAAGRRLDRKIRFTRRRAVASRRDDWCSSSAPLLAPTVHPLGESLESLPGALQVDFANRVVGGAAIAYGCVQEEILFCERPELICARLLCSPMEDDEAITFFGAEQFSAHTGYAETLRHRGPYCDASAVAETGELETWIVAMDATPFGRDDGVLEFTSPLVLRELTKAWAAFDRADVPDAVATGNWGCGVFGGDVQLKSVIQWLAASRAGKKLHYFPWGSTVVATRFPAVAEHLVAAHVTVGTVARCLLSDRGPANTYERLQALVTAGGG